MLSSVEHEKRFITSGPASLVSPTQIVDCKIRKDPKIIKLCLVLVQHRKIGKQRSTRTEKC